MRRVNIIHLSDIHFDNSKESNNILEALKEDLEKMKDDIGDFHLLLITGDCVNKGHVELFEIFCDKLNGILKKCTINKRKVAIVLGNHDASKENPLLISFLDGITSKKMTETEALNKLEPRIATLYPEYNEIIKNYARTPDGIGVIEFSVKNDNQTNSKIRVILINSSWSTVINNKYGELVVGDTQLDVLKKNIEELNCKQKKSKQKKCDYTILCMHHPLDWFKYVERSKVERFIKSSEVDFVLHGHIHTAGFDNVNNVDNTSNIFCTGISYHKTGENCSRKDGMRYSIYEINKDTQTVNVYIRSTNDEGNFVEDNRLYKNSKNGFFTMPLENPYNCILPFKSVDSVSKMYTVLNQETVCKILLKEKLLFDLYCNMERSVQSEYILVSGNKVEEEYKEWAAKNCNVGKKEFFKKQFELFCFEFLLNMYVVFFKESESVRLLIRLYDKVEKTHKTFVSTGSIEDADKIKNFLWKTSLIYHSYKKEAALLQSCNYKHYEKGNSNTWKDSLTVTINNICINSKSEMIPILSFSISISDQKYETCLQALALSSIYEKVREIFNLFNDRVFKLVDLYE